VERSAKLIAGMRLPGGALPPGELVRAAWPQAVGKRIASRARATGLAGETLIVEVDDEIWQGQLSTLRGQILEKLSQVLGRVIVTQIEFRLSVPRRLPQRASTASGDEAERIQDPSLRMAYKSSRRRARA
jgi:hypothetical protein